MNGREEVEAKLEERNMRIVSHHPEYFKKFYYYLDDKTANTKYGYLCKVIDFMIYMENELLYDVSTTEDYQYITHSDLDFYIKSLPIGNKARATIYYALRCFFKFLVFNDYIDRSPFERVVPPKYDKYHKVTYLTKEEIDIVHKNMINGVGTDYQKCIQKKLLARNICLFDMALSLGFRSSSLLQINMEDIDWDNNIIRIVKKGNKIQEEMFSDKLKEEMIRWKNRRDILLITLGVETDAFFISRNGKRLSTSAFGQLLKTFTYNIDKKISPHKLRSTCATMYYDRTKDIHATSKKLGHSDISTTMIYIGEDERKRMQMAKLLDDFIL